jgi:outer membrane protein assembly factor BamB
MRKTFVLLSPVLAATLTALAADPAAGSPWPRFRGPNGTGIAGDKDIPVEWTDKEGVLWRVPIPGVGNSSPVVWGERVFVQSASTDGKQRFLLCLNAADGKTLWTQTVPGIRAHTHDRNTLASSTPATDGERVYALLWDGQNVWLHGYTVQGQPLWKHKVGGFVSQHGAGASPIVFQNKVLLNYDQDGAAELLALNAKTGKPIWQAARRPYRASYSTPFILEKEGVAPELIMATTGGITSYDLETGNEYWNFNVAFTGMPLRMVASPIYTQGLIIANSGDGNGSRHTVAVKAAGKGDVSQTNLAWQETRTFPYVPTMLAYGDHIYGVNDRGLAICHVTATGQSMWNERLGGGFTASPVLIDGKIYAINEEGVVFVIRAAPTFTLLAKNSMGERVMASPAVADNRLYVRGQESLFCIGKPANRPTGQR